VCKNAKGLKFHRAKSKTCQEFRQEQRLGGNLSETQEDSSQDTHDEMLDSQGPDLLDLLTDTEEGNADTQESGTQPKEEHRRQQHTTTEKELGVK